MKSVLFVSANTTWGGSEILWSNSALQLMQEGFKVKFAVKYNSSVIDRLVQQGATYIYLDAHKLIQHSILDKTLIKLKLKSNEVPQETFLACLLEERPQLVVLSQGNNIDGLYYMDVCRQQHVPFVTITQLVAEYLLEFTNDTKINNLRINYAASRMNYFVSNANLELHNRMLGETMPNCKIVLNPFAVPVDVSGSYPSQDNGYWRIALVGRLNTFHKGHDLLLQVLKQEKWHNRPVKFSFYGAGLHEELLKRLVKTYGIRHVKFEGHVQDVAQIWQHNHLLILPSRMEGQALALIEAMWCHRAAIVTNVGGATELITDEETGFIAAAPTYTAIDEALENAWRYRDEWEQMGINAGRKIREVYAEHPIALFTKELKIIIKDLSLATHNTEG